MVFGSTPEMVWNCSIPLPFCYSIQQTFRQAGAPNVPRSRSCTGIEANQKSGCLKAAKAIRREIPGVFAEQFGNPAKNAGLNHHALMHLIVFVQS